MTAPNHDVDPEFTAMISIFGMLKNLDVESQNRVIQYVSQKLGLAVPVRHKSVSNLKADEPTPDSVEQSQTENSRHDDESDELGISPAGVKWAKRNGLSGDELSKIFSLGIDEIDLVSKKVPGESKRDRLRSVFLLKGIAAYLSTGVAKFSHDDVKETCTHYDAWDQPNFSRSLTSISSEISGNKESGYVLTARGLASAAEIIKSLLQQ